MPANRLLVVAATVTEIRPFMDAVMCQPVQSNCFSGFYKSMPIDVLITGIGLTATTYQLTRRLSTQSYQLVLNAGICGSYSTAYPVGQVVEVVCEAFGDLGVEDHDAFYTLSQAGLQSENDLPFINNRLVNPVQHAAFYALPKVNGLTVHKASGSQLTIQRLTEAFSPEVESMESAAFFYTCLLESVPFASVRAVSNRVEPRNRTAWNIPLAIKNLNDFLTDQVQGEGFF